LATKRFYGKLGFGGITAAVNLRIGPNFRFLSLNINYETIKRQKVPVEQKKVNLKFAHSSTAPHRSN
jgi:hypothetical protein